MALMKIFQVPAFAVTDDTGKPYVAEIDGQNKGFFFLDPGAAETYAARVRELQKAGAPVGIECYFPLYHMPEQKQYRKSAQVPGALQGTCGWRSEHLFSSDCQRRASSISDIEWVCSRAANDTRRCYQVC